MFFEVLFFISIFIIFFGEFLYPKIILFLPKNPVKKFKGIPGITILIPAFNEENCIAVKIKNTLSLNYPEDKREIVVVDNGSSDKTYEIAGEFPITMLKSERGKINALNQGINYAKTDIIVMTDADVGLDKESVRSAVSYLNGNVGAVSGYVVAKAQTDFPLLKEKEKYKKKDWELRYQESMIDSACNLDGKFIVFRKSIFPGFLKNSLIDDYPMTFYIRGKGHRLIVDKSAKVYEKLEGGFKEEINQFTRYATSTLLVNFKNIHFLFNPKYGYFGLLTFPFRRFFPVLYPIFLLYSVIFLSISAATNIYGMDASITVLILGLSAIFILIIAISLLYYKRLMLIQLLAVLYSYINLFKKNNLKLGKWSTLRN